MKLFLVYKPILTDEMYRSINKCSNDTDWKNAYFRSGLMNDRNAQEIVDECARTALYRLAAVAYVDELEQVFDIGNGYPVKPEHRYTRIRNAPSVSVGDLVYDTEQQRMYGCCDVGWTEVYVPEVMQHTVYTHTSIHMSEVAV